MIETGQLRNRLSEIDRARDEEWLEALPGRKAEERDFHDVRADRQTASEEEIQSQGNSNKKFYDYTQDSRDYLERWIQENSRGKVVLDYACGDGTLTLLAARSGASLAIGLDISGISVETARRRASEAGLKNTFFLQGDCENTLLPDASVEVILCSGMLHHLDLSYAFPEMRRILAPGGRALAYEALDYNPLIRLYRRLTPELRTRWEKDHILDLEDLRFARRFFEVRDVRFWHLLSIFSTYARPLAPVFRTLDGYLSRVPLLRRLAWVFTFELVRREED